MCTSPMHAFRVGLTDNLKPKYKLESGSVERIHMPRYTGNRSTFHQNGTWQDLWITEYIEVPCGQCFECRLNYSRFWATRCMLESKEWEHNFMVTLTYDPEHVPVNNTIIDKETGEVVPGMTLVKEHLEKFNKDLRRYYDYHYKHQNIRYYAAGEYGEQSMRPHYHVIYFNLPIPDLVPFGKNELGQPYYYSATLEKIWGKGFVGVSEVAWESCAYVARYVMKKQKGKEATAHYEHLGILPEFCVMSRNPGIARAYYENNKDKIYATDELIVPGADGKAIVMKPGAYYDRLYDFEQEDPFVMADIKSLRRKLAEESMKQKMLSTDKTKEEILKDKEEKREKQIKLLKRNKIE